MSFSGQKPSAIHGAAKQANAELSEASSQVQLKRELAGLSYDEQRAKLQPTRGVGGALSIQMLPGSDTPSASPEAPVSGAVVSGPIGRLFNRICGVDENRTDTAGLTFGEEQLRAYLDVELQMAEGEFFRGTKLKGISKNLIEQLDVDGDGLLCWDEFKAFEGHILERIAPEVGADATGIEAEAAARSHHSDLAGPDGELDYGQLKERAHQELPEQTEHKSLIAQLAARVTLDALDKDERNKPISERTLSSDEWAGGAREIGERQESMG